MRKWNLITLVSLVLLSSCAPVSAGQQQFDKEKFIKEGFVQLFNGKDLAGWKIPEGDNGHWKVVDGVIDYDAQSEAKGSKNLWTEGAFGDYTLHIEWRFKRTTGLYAMPTILPDGSYKTDADGNAIKTPTPNADSGIFLRGTGGSQVNLWCWPIGSGELWSVRNNKKLAPELRAAAVPKVRADKPVGQWNSMDITMMGDRITAVLNDKTVIENAQIPGISERGPIGMQHHGGINKKTGEMGSASSLIQFRNVWVKKLDGDDKGFVSLFNGNNLAGWITGQHNAWVAEDGVLTVKRDMDGKEHNFDYLWTEKTYGDFILDMEFKVTEGTNSGIFLRTSDINDPVQTGIEVQISNSYGRKDLSRGGTAGAIYDCLAPTKNTVKKAGEWNRCRITCDDNKILVVLNGEQITNMDLNKWTKPHENPGFTKNKFNRALKDFARRGHIGLQDHGRPIWYRNISIKSLDGTTKGSFTMVSDAHGMVLKTPDGRTVLRYMTKKPADTKLTANSVCCLYPVNTPSGERVVDFAPSDHPHHRGAFLAWHSLTGKQKADFWGWGAWAPTKGRVIKNRSVKLVEADSTHATFEVRNAWNVEEVAMINEVLSVTASEQSAGRLSADNAYVIDLHYRLTPTVEVTLDKTAFGGFCVKARKDGKSVYTSPKGEVKLPNPHHLKPETDWPAADWYDYTIKLNSGKTVGVTVFDHPANPPTTWHNLRTISMVNPCIVAPGAVTMKKGQPFDLRYRLVAHDGPVPEKLLKKLSEQWRGSRGSETFELEEGFVRLDNGKDLEGWAGFKRDWSVVSGAIHLEYKSPPTGGSIFSNKTHSNNAVIRMQFRASDGGDSGVFIHGNQFQVRDYPNSYPDTEKYAPFCKPAGQWNDLEFDITNGIAVVKLNGTVIHKAWKIGERAKQGIGLQKEKGNFDYRYIRLKEKK